ncbi:MAG: TrkH family potassium uptake protein [Spirochaetota bacterium]
MVVLPNFSGNVHYALYITILVLRIITVVTIMLFNKEGRKLLIGSLKLMPAQTFVVGFLFLILIGTFILSLPVSVNDKDNISIIDSLFTSTSAVCVTGLIVVDTGTYYSLFGQVTILLLIQLGGLGIMTFGSFIAIIMGSRMSLHYRYSSLEIYDQPSFEALKALIKTVVVGTLLIELIGAVIIYFSINNQLTDWSALYKIYFSIFHSISSFCNAGFSLNSDNLVMFRYNIGVNIIVMTLIVLGGIGFGVILNIRNYLGSVFKSLFSKKPAPNIPLKIQSKIVVITSIILILMGALLFMLYEWDNILNSEDIGNAVMQSLFHSITTRTAGFNTVDTGIFKDITYFFIIILMFIGASPGSTGGGIKTSTFFVIFKTTGSILRNRKEVLCFKKKLSTDIIKRSIAVIFSYMFVIVLATLLLYLTEEFNIIPILFEVVSAIATVGLSTGITFDLTNIGKIIITLVMFTGRIGVVTFLYLFFNKEEHSYIKYPEENLSIG